MVEGGSGAIENPQVLTKYQTAAACVHTAMNAVLAQILPGVLISDLCALGDSVIEDAAQKVYRKGAIVRGVAFPTCVSPNGYLGHKSPLPGKDDYALQVGDMVKVDMGAHIDGYASQLATTVCVVPPGETVTGPQADVMSAAYVASEVVLRMLKPGTTDQDIVGAISKVAQDFGVTPVQGVYHYSQEQWSLVSQRVMFNSAAESRGPAMTLEANEVVTVDIIMSTGCGVGKQTEDTPTLYQRNPTIRSHPTLKSADMALRQIDQSPFPFHMRTMEGHSAAGMRLLEKKEYIDHFAPTVDAVEGAQVAQVKFTVAITPKKHMRLCEVPTPSLVRSVKSISPWVQQMVKMNPSVHKR
ncbi:hypothetical protein KIPB_006225 [Kipferlia bialata]|uniref:Peptidase M24 domain-containing protein n=1 Tax=Kipferlia bialata TaxID=797122 RepID=A0A9K3CY77_9EUKA|nr:hypothetical protein KIPB_003965 [Kipferlia bialata]GIQ84682.1 hypothetical protein KIPB_006225 [Kipferlia bialata]|eukprot:g3965.t1